MTRAVKGASKRNQLRIIGGSWRGRKLGFPTLEGLRPTTDRVRETLFNWLTADIHNARCLDLFAGSGALGLEALSRGASSCTFVDASAIAIKQLQENLATLGHSDTNCCFRMEAGSFLNKTSDAWDIVFIDPPFGAELVDPACLLLAPILPTGALIYIETSTGDPTPNTPPHWQLHREKQAGEVCYRLFIVASQ